ncbi:MAG: ABC transporter permease [Acidimicrobiales bacterium]
MHETTRGLPFGARRLLSSVSRPVAFTVAVAFIVAPLAWIALLSVSQGFKFPDLAPTGFTLRWWRQVLQDHGLLHAVFLSVITAPLVLALSALICLPAAYAIGRHEFRGKRGLLLGIFSVNAFPRISLYISMIPVLFFFGLMGKLVGVVVVQLIGTIVFMTWIPATGFAAVPAELVEAARDAGAGRLQVFRRVLLPVARPSIAVASVLAFIAAFDEAQGTFLVGAPTYVTMPVEMYNLVTNYPAEVSAVFAVLLSVPSAILLFAVRKVLFGAGTASALHLR